MQSAPGYSQNSNQTESLDSKSDLVAILAGNAKSEMHVPKDCLFSWKPVCDKSQADGPRNRHNSSHKHHQTEFDLNSLPMEEFRSVITQELHLKEKGVREHILIGGFHPESESELSKDEHSCGGSTVDDETRVLEDTLGKLSLTPSKSHRSNSSQNSKSDSEEEARELSNSVQSSLSCGSNDGATSEENSVLSEAPQALTAVESVSQYRVVRSAVVGTSQQYVPNTQSLPAKDARDRFTSSISLTQ